MVVQESRSGRQTGQRSLIGKRENTSLTAPGRLENCNKLLNQNALDMPHANNSDYIVNNNICHIVECDDENDGHSDCDEHLIKVKAAFLYGWHLKYFVNAKLMQNSTLNARVLKFFIFHNFFIIYAIFHYCVVVFCTVFHNF